MLLHEFAVKLPEAAFRALYEANPEIARLLIQQFTRVANSQGWPFEYTDQIGSACARLFSATSDPDIRAMLTATALEVGVSHNRYYVMDVAGNLVQQTKDDNGALALAHALEPMKGQLNAVTGRVNIARLNPIVRELFASE